MPGTGTLRDMFTGELTQDYRPPKGPWRKGFGPESPPGLITPGNIDDLGTRPAVRFQGEQGEDLEGTILSSTHQVGDYGEESPDEDAPWVIIPTIYSDEIPGISRKHTEQEARKRYRKTGKHLGIFSTLQDSLSHSKRLSDEQGRNLRALQY